MTRLRGLRYRTETRLATMVARLGSPVNLDSRLARGSQASVHEPRPPRQSGRSATSALLDDEVEDDDAGSSVDRDIGAGVGGRNFDTYESAYDAAVQEGHTNVDAHAMGRAVSGLPGSPDEAMDNEPTENEPEDNDVDGGEAEGDVRGNNQPVISTPRRSPRLRALQAVVDSSTTTDSAPFDRSIRTPGGRHFDHDAMDEWSNWAQNGRFCNNHPPYF